MKKISHLLLISIFLQPYVLQASSNEYMIMLKEMDDLLTILNREFPSSAPSTPLVIPDQKLTSKDVPVGVKQGELNPKK